MDDLLNILNDVYQEVKDEDVIKITEIGTGTGQDSTVRLFEFFRDKYVNFKIDSYEGEASLFKLAHNYWSGINTVNIIEEYFSNKEDIPNLLIPNLPNYIKDYKETSDRFKEKYMKVYNLPNNNYTKNVNFIPNIVFIDASRFMHINIINKCYELYNQNPECIYIIEDDYFIDGNYGELEIIENNFILKDVKKYSKGTWQWPFVTFKIVGKK
tara:strand:+ start:3159 stop:3794 length:636 start_codon:yes stop_codon:yes gene_type:complete